MHTPLPFGLFIEHEQPTEADLVFIQSIALKLTNIREASNLEAFKIVRTLPDGGYVVATQHYGTFRIGVYKTKPNEPRNDGFASDYIPMLLSGRIEKAQVLDLDEGIGITLTEQCRRRLIDYKTNLQLPLKRNELFRLKIGYGENFKYFEPKNKGIYFFSQYIKHRPTWYSGAMSEAIQIISGYGKLTIDDLPEKSKDNPAEKPALILPPDYARRIKEELQSIRMPACKGIPHREGQLQYQYGFSLSHIISFDPAGKAWLIQIDSSGVHALPLPLIPATMTHAFREYMEHVQDDEVLAVLDRFGGLPSGELFPQGDAFHAWKRAGVIIKICDTADFYEHSAMYTACGWSCNTQGTSAFNTCWSYGPNGLMQAYGYQMNLQLATSENMGWLKPVQISADDDEAKNNLLKIRTYIEKLTDYLDPGTELTLAIMYKLRRVPQEMILARAENILDEGAVVDKSDADYWDLIELSPIANHTGRVGRVSAGPVYWGLKEYPMSMGRLKFPELTGAGCESFVMVSKDYEGPEVKCDTVVFGAYAGDDLKVVKYFIDKRTFHRETESNFEEIMILGEWEKTETAGESGLQGYFYTSDFDDRQEVPDSTVYTHIKGTDMGYGNPMYSTPPLLFTRGSVSKYRYYKHEVSTNTVSSFGLDIGICIPVFSRDAILYAYTDSEVSKSESVEHIQYAHADKTSYEMWTYDSIFHWLGGTGKGDPAAKDGKPVYVDVMHYNDADTTGFADSGDWLGLGGNYINITSIVGSFTERGSANHANGVIVGGESPYMPPYKTFKQINGEQRGRVHYSNAEAPNALLHRQPPEAWYFAFSPVDAGGLTYFYRDTCSITFGASKYSNVSEKPANSDRRPYWGFTALADHRESHIFIGVINE